ncbi:MAG: hypothetical protein WD060_01640, partial [Pirellulales bacterium]
EERRGPSFALPEVAQQEPREGSQPRSALAAWHAPLASFAGRLLALGLGVRMLGAGRIEEFREFWDRESPARVQINFQRTCTNP